MQIIQNPELVKALSIQFRYYNQLLESLLEKVSQKLNFEISAIKLTELKAFENYLRVFNPQLANLMQIKIQDLELYLYPRSLLSLSQHFAKSKINLEVHHKS